MEQLRRYAPIIDDVEAFLEACRRPLPTTVRVQTSRVSTSRVRGAFEAAGIAATPLSWSDHVLEVDAEAVGRTLPAYLGWVHGQEAASCLPVPLLDIEPGDVVWDAAAAPGSKTGHIVDRLGDDGLVIATDDNLGRLSALRFNLERLGATAVAVDHADARRFDPSAIGVDAVDAALVDAPCTGEGTVRKKPSVIEEGGPDAAAGLAPVQRDILTRAIDLTTPGGSVVYSTCTFAPEENEAVVDAVLANRECTIEPIELPIPAAPGVTDWSGETYDDRLSMTRRVYPHLGDTGGFYLAKLRVGA